MADEDGPAAPTPVAKAGFGRTMKAVLWSFFGVRKRSDYEKDAVQLDPVRVIIAALIGAALFVFILIMIVRSVVR